MGFKKKQLAVIGDPITHSLSPLIQNAAIEKLKIPITYKAIRVPSERLKEFVRTQARKLVGFNVTVPHKRAILPYLNSLSQEAKIIGAVNTVLNKNGKLFGFNTDGTGYLKSLHETAHFDPRGKNIVVLGAGGAARGIATVLALSRAKSITLANRTLSRAREVVRDLKIHFKHVKWYSTVLFKEKFKKSLKQAHLLINTTSIGLKGTAFENFPFNHLKTQCLVSDIVYHPRMTPFLKQAKRLSHPIHTGEGMLVYQGALALELWTGCQPDIRLMKKVLLEALKKR